MLRNAVFALFELYFDLWSIYMIAWINLLILALSITYRPNLTLIDTILQNRSNIYSWNLIDLIDFGSVVLSALIPLLNSLITPPVITEKSWRL